MESCTYMFLGYVNSSPCMSAGLNCSFYGHYYSKYTYYGTIFLSYQTKLKCSILTKPCWMENTRVVAADDVEPKSWPVDLNSTSHIATFSCIKFIHENVAIHLMFLSWSNPDNLHQSSF